MTSSSDFAPSNTRIQALTRFRQKLSTVGIDTAGLDARLLTSHALDISLEKLLTDGEEEVGVQGAKRLNESLKRRLTGESVARIMGRREFWGLPFHLSNATLEPRPDTETLIEAVLDSFPDRQSRLKILDLGTGTGCILIALLTEYRQASGVATDISPEALEIASRNIDANGVAERCVLKHSDWFNQIEGRFDIILSNPPYIRSSDIAGLAAEVKAFDPLTALDGGKDGLDAYRRILHDGLAHLERDGRIFLEIGFDQWPDLERLSQLNGFGQAICRRDLAGHPRVVILPHPEMSEHPAG